MSAENNDHQKVLLAQYQSFLDVYKQHFELFIKGIFAYLAAISVVAGYVFGKDASAETKIALSTLIPIASLVALLGCIKSRRWVLDLKVAVEDIEGALRIPRYPFSGPLGIIFSIIVAALIFLVFGLANLVLQVVMA